MLTSYGEPTVNDNCGPFGRSEMTTGAALGALRQDLRDHGFDEDQAHDVVMVYVRETAGDGFCVPNSGGAA